ncbi:hypothetical protein BMF89_14975 [Arthrobacter sp. SRS-W-1-2016]|uniref:hypothetical protein n=1 Tax=Arthrobacter sp. SRS-W-1-2016 TaxID=1930254 RepID=UPI0009913FA2|nr:hypothetical protein [Arthrobacter sp. SRS-W-1-2016]OOP60937.1 hypothetical protein BMF89_14975 [Arthrobacter sp. SRS-W-1-2016]
MTRIQSTDTEKTLTLHQVGPLAGAARTLTVLAATATLYDQGIRHIATLAGYLSYGLMALTVCFGILTTTGWARRLVSRHSLSATHMVAEHHAWILLPAFLRVRWAARY